VSRVQGAGFRVQGSGFRVQCSVFSVQWSGFRVQGSRFRGLGSGCGLSESIRPADTAPSLFVACRFSIVQRHSPLLGLVDPSFQALSGRLEFTARRHTFNRDSLAHMCAGIWAWREHTVCPYRGTSLMINSLSGGRFSAHAPMCAKVWCVGVCVRVCVCVRYSERDSVCVCV